VHISNLLFVCLFVSFASPQSLNGTVVVDLATSASLAGSVKLRLPFPASSEQSAEFVNLPTGVSALQLQRLLDLVSLDHLKVDLGLNGLSALYDSANALAPSVSVTRLAFQLDSHMSPSALKCVQFSCRVIFAPQFSHPQFCLAV
jgi:hypothetical protein